MYQSVSTFSNVQPYQGNDKVIVVMVRHFPSCMLVLSPLNLLSSSFNYNNNNNNNNNFPHLAINLISISKFCIDNNSIFEFHPHFFLIKDQDMWKAYLQSKLKNGLY